MMQQIRLSGVKTSSQVPYWLPVTWQEHTMASVLASLMGFPLASVLFITSIITVFSLFIGQILIAVLTSFAVFATAFMASTATVTNRMALNFNSLTYCRSFLIYNFILLSKSILLNTMHMHCKFDNNEGFFYIYSWATIFYLEHTKLSCNFESFYFSITNIKHT